jgi:voltage-gated potassium channel
MDSARNLRLSLSILTSVLVAGTIGYTLIEGWPLFDSLYMTVITLATVGFKEVHDLSPQGKTFTIALIVFGVGVITYTAGSVIQFMVEGQLGQLVGRRKMTKQIDRLKEHYIICGFGRIGQMICREFQARPVPFVVVEKNAHLCERLAREGTLFVHGNATDDETLQAAGIERAKGLITAVTSDTDNVYITLTARGLNPQLFILARAGEEGAEVKLMRAGASKVISPYVIGATRMAHAILRPTVVDFIELATARENLALQLEEIEVVSSSSLVGRDLVEAGIRQTMGIIIVAIKQPDGHMLFNPAPATRIVAGSVLIILGERPAITRLEQIAQGHSGAP